MRYAILVLTMVCSPAFAQTAPRGQTNDFSIHLIAIGSKDYRFEDGASARNNGGGGVGATVARNLNDHFAVGADLTFSQFGLRSRIAPGDGNAGAAFETEGDIEQAAFRLHATWSLLSGPTTPFLTAGIGANYLNPTFDSNPPASGCWVYPLYGQVCGATPPTSPVLRLGYGAATGVRIDLPRRQGHIRVMVGGEWLEIPEAASTVGYIQFRADFGISF